MNTYKFFYNGKETIISIDAGMYEAKLKAIDFFKPKKSQVHMVHGVLIETLGKEVIHTADF